MLLESFHLSDRESQVLILFADGFTYGQIGRRMGISARTVDTYLRRIRAKTGAVSGAELVRLGLRLSPRDGGAGSG